MSGGWFDDEAIAEERLHADLLQVQYEAESRAYMVRQRSAQEAFDRGQLEVAARHCPHGAGFPLASRAAQDENDPNRGEDGYRCVECGSRLTESPFDGGTVTVPCEQGTTYFDRP